MAVEAHHLHLFSPQFLMNQDLAIKGLETRTPAMFFSSQTGEVMPLLAPSDSGITVAGGGDGGSGKKRARETLSFFGEDLSLCFQQQMSDIDRLLDHHTERMRLELGDRRRQLVATIENGMNKRLKAKEEEIERCRKMNWVMEDRIRSLCMENQIWKELAQTNEATANLLRTNLEHLLAAQIRNKEEQQLCDESAPADDAESCCCGGGGDERDTAAAMVRACRNCGKREATVLILPCRHLGICSACCPVTNSCPICNCLRTGSVNVNLS